MDPDTEDAAWHQQEQEGAQYQEFLANDPGYVSWIETIYQEYESEICSESVG
jgi:hypothetical protein